LTPAWLKAHTDPHAADVALPSLTHQYTPTSLLKVAGPEQLRQEWVATKGMASYQALQRELRRYAAAHGTTIAAYEANEGGLQ